MQFAHTINQVLAGTKTQTSRIWRDNYKWGSNHETIMNAPTALYNVSKLGDIRRHYYVGQVLSVQEGRGKKGVAHIRITDLAQRDVRSFDAGDIQREGFKIPFDFYEVWTALHDKPFAKTLDRETLAGNWITPLWQQPSEYYQALVIRFELLDSTGDKP